MRSGGDFDVWTGGGFPSLKRALMSIACRILDPVAIVSLCAVACDTAYSRQDDGADINEESS